MTRQHVGRHIRLPVLAAALAGLLSFGAHATGKVEVKAAEPDKFFDIGISTIARERNLQTLTEFLQKLGAQLPDGQVLTVELLDVDLAGHVNPMCVQEIRVVRGGADWPKITLRYTLQDGSTTLKSGEERLVDINYATHGRSARYANRELGYEMRMLQRWFDETIASKKIAHKP